MSILGNIFRKIFPSSHPAANAGGAPGTSAPPVSGQASTTPAPAGAGTSASKPTAAAPTAAGSGAQPASTQPSAAQPAAPVDVEAILTSMASTSGQTLNWRTSIVDLMKLLGLDSSLAERKELAKELGYTGDMNDSASMNIWLHKQVMRKLAENGGKVPADLKD
jgi:hypothetical protein